MPMPSGTAEYSLYRTRRQYRATARSTSIDGSIYLADACVDDCIRECVALDDSGYPSSLLAQECRRGCESHCAGPSCPEGEGVCYSPTSPQRRCCPYTHECCLSYEYPSYRSILSCCLPGQNCCGGVCYWPSEQQCSPGGLLNCPTGRASCYGECCDTGEICTPEGTCSRPDHTCHGHICGPGEVCRDKCCPPAAATSSQCCPSGVSCENVCCATGEICTYLDDPSRLQCV